MKKTNVNNIIIIALFSFFLMSCGNSKSDFPVVDEPAQIIVSEQGLQDFALVLHDMDVNENEEYIYYKHRYAIIHPTDDTISVDSTGWLNVSKDFFLKNEKNLGMEIVSRVGDHVSTTPKPVGFDWAIGNEKYGSWERDSTSTSGKEEKSWRYNRSGSFFMYYWMFSRATPMGAYNGYAKNYRGKSAYYGSGKQTYGTSSAYNKSKRADFYKRKSSSSSWKSFSSKTSRSSSRYNGASKTRGRSGGVGK